MGGQSSTRRKVTFDNDEPVTNANVIKVSDDVVHRLRGAEEVRRQAAAAQRPFADNTATVPVGQPPAFYHYQPSLTSLQLRQEVLNELQKSDEYWERRIRNLEKSHSQMKQIMEEEYLKAMEEQQIKKMGLERCQTPCIVNRKDVLACYKKYPKEPMRCAKVVQEFTKCVDSSRVTVLESSRG